MEHVEKMDFGTPDKIHPDQFVEEKIFEEKAKIADDREVYDEKTMLLGKELEAVANHPDNEPGELANKLIQKEKEKMLDEKYEALKNREIELL